MKNAAHSVGQELTGIVAFIGVIWGVFILNGIVIGVDFNSFGLVPRTLRGAVGILSMPFLHANWVHLLKNTVPLFVLLALLAGSKARSWEIVELIIVASGALLWIVGRNATHVGASALIFGLAAFLIISGLLEKRVIPLAVSVVAGILYGGALIGGVLPSRNTPVSWEGHLCGVIAGVIVAWFLTKEPKQKSEEYVAA